MAVAVVAVQVATTVLRLWGLIRAAHTDLQPAGIHMSLPILFSWAPMVVEGSLKVTSAPWSMGGSVTWTESNSGALSASNSEGLALSSL